MDSQQILILVIVVLTLINLVLSSVTLSRTGTKSNYRICEELAGGGVSCWDPKSAPQKEAD